MARTKENETSFFELQCRGCGATYETWVQAKKEISEGDLGIQLKQCPLCLGNVHEIEE